MLTPSARSTSAEPEYEESARLPCLATGTPQPATTSALAVEMLKLPEASPPVPQVSIVPGGASLATALARMVRAAPAISSTVSPRTRSAIRRAPTCEAVALPLMMMSNAASAWASLRLRPAATCASRGLRSAVSSGGMQPLYQPAASDGIGTSFSVTAGRKILSVWQNRSSGRLLSCYINLLRPQNRPSASRQQ